MMRLVTELWKEAEVEWKEEKASGDTGVLVVPRRLRLGKTTEVGTKPGEYGLDIQ